MTFLCDYAVYKSRRDKLRNLLQKKRLDALLVSDPANRFYLSGFELHNAQFNESSGMLVICADGKDWLLTDSRYELAANKLWEHSYIYIYKNWQKEIPCLLAKCGSKTGFEASAISFKFAEKLINISRCASGPVFLPVENMVESLRIKKEPCEIAALKNSFKLNHSLLKWLGQKLEKGEIYGLAEKKLAWQAECFFRENGADELAFNSIIASGTNCALPHATPGDDVIMQNSIFMADVGCRVENYCSDQTRTWWLGSSMPNHIKKSFDLVKEAQNAALNIMKPGVECASVYAAANEVFIKSGVERHFTHGLGHGVGLETHEAPSLNPGSRHILEPGMVVTVEPGLYYPEWGGIRLEYTVLVEENGISIF